jgi:Bacterial membrane protein YfhO/6-pyruvoyl-tetrahydropterin synthase related domain
LTSTPALVDWLRRHEYVAAGLFFALVLGIYFIGVFDGNQLGQSHILFGEVPWHYNEPAGIEALTRNAEGDAAHTFYPLLVAARAQVHAGHIPLWNPDSYAGTVLLGDMQSALLFPLTWLALILPLKFAWGLIVVLKLLIAALGTYALARQLSVGRSGALLAGVVYMLSAPEIVFAQSPQGTVFALLPWLLLTTDRLYRHRDGVRFVQLAIVVLLIVLAGHPESAALSYTAAGLYLLVLALRDPGARARVRERGKTIGLWVGAVALGVAASGAALIPFIQAYRPSADRVEHHLQAGSYLSPHVGLLYAVPTIYGDGQPHVYLYTPFPLYQTVAGYFGIVALLLAAVAFARGRRRPEVQALGVVALVAAMALFDVPPVSWIAKHVPPFSSIVVQRVYVFIALAGALGAGAAFTSLSRRKLSERSIARIALAGIVIVAVFLIVEETTGRLVAPSHVKLAAIERAILFFALGIGCLAMLGRARGIAPFLLVVAVCVLDLVFLQGYNVSLPPAKAYPPKPGSIAYLQRQPGLFRVSAIRVGYAADVFLPNAAATYGLEGIEGHDPPVSKRWALFERNVLGQQGLTLERLLTAPQTSGPSLTALRMMNTRFYIARPGAPSPNPALHAAYTGPDATVFEDPEALPRAYVVPSIRPASDSDALGILSRGGIDPRQTALVPAGTPALPAEQREFSAAPAKEVSPDHVRVSVNGGGGGWLVLANSYSPQWRAKVDGHSVKLRPTNYAAMGVALPPGRHTVDFQLSHRGFWFGVVLSLASLAAMGGVLLVAWRRRRRS